MIASRRQTALALSAVLALTIFMSIAVTFSRQRQREADTRALIRAVLERDDDVALSLLDQGADPNATVTKNDMFPSTQFLPGPLLTNSLRNGEQKVALALIAHGANANARDSKNSTPLSLAVGYRMRPAVATLLTHGADVNARDSENETALFYGIDGSSQDQEIVRLLINHGVDVNVQETGFGQTALIREVSDPTSSNAIIIQLLLSAHPNIELRDMGGNTALRTAEKEGDFKAVQTLRTAGAKEYSLFPQTVIAKVKYTIKDLGPGSAEAINSHGDVAGVASEGKADFDGQILGQAFVWSRGHSQRLKAFRGPSSVAYDINDQRQVVGAADLYKAAGSSCYTRHAFLWQNGVMRDLHPRSGWTKKFPNVPSAAVSISRDGQVVGNISGSPFLWGGGKRQNQEIDVKLGSMPLDGATPIAINNRGQVILALQTSGWEQAGFWQNGKTRELSPPKREEFVVDGEKHTNTPNDYVEGINDKGNVVGYTDENEAVLWHSNVISVLPGLYHYKQTPFGTHAEHISNRGLIVGTVSDDINAKHPEQHAVLWQNRKALDLNTLIPAGSGWLLEDARSINDSGQIVGRGRYNGREEAFLLAPR